MEFQRNYPIIQRLIEAGQSIIVLGSRGSGKTYFLSRLVKNHHPLITVDLLDRLEYDRMLRRPQQLTLEIESALKEVTNTPLLIFIDEIQRIPSLLNEVHRLIELYKPNLFFILTGSSARKLKDEEANLLAARALRQNFFPLGIDEFNIDKKLSIALQYGCLPQVLAEKNLEIKMLYLKTYVGTYLQEEIQRESRIRNMEGFARFLEFAAIENGNLINYEKIGKAVGITDTTVKSYYQLLSDTLIAYEVPAWINSIRKQLQRASRYYLFDNGVINALTGELLTELKPATNRFGKLFESFIIQQVIQALEKQISPNKYYHYREYEGLEVDLILQKNPYAAPLAVEIKSSPNPTAKEVKNLISFKKHFPNAHLAVICQTTRQYEEEGIVFLGVKEGIVFVSEWGK